VLALDSYRAWRNGAATHNYKSILHMKIVAFCLCWVLILTASGVMAQQGHALNQSWDVLRQLQGGEKLDVEKKTGKKKVSGRFVSLSDAELVIARKGNGESFSRDRRSAEESSGSSWGEPGSNGMIHLNGAWKNRNRRGFFFEVRL